MLPTHFAFSDDSKHHQGRFNSLAVLTVNRDHIKRLNAGLLEIYKNSDVGKEFKWGKLSSAKYRFAAEKILDFIFLNRDKLRIDVIIWDLLDSRHRGIIHRDDNANLVRMYYHLISSILSQRWPIDGHSWRWFPDNQSSVDWNVLWDCINGKKHNFVNDLFRMVSKFQRVKLLSIIPTPSHSMPLIQVSDLFAGLGSYSWGHFEKFIEWERTKSKQLELIPTPNKEINFTPAEEEKFHVLKRFYSACRKNNLPISFQTKKGLRTNNPNCFINFWSYTPQTIMDKAPRKIKFPQLK
ncbi:MAG: DUF3800 domain-containing protein [Candidatus Doudnabacteria bacterium]